MFLKYFLVKKTWCCLHVAATGAAATKQDGPSYRPFIECHSVAKNTNDFPVYCMISSCWLVTNDRQTVPPDDDINDIYGKVN